ncbi:MAG: CoA transferase [Sphingomonadales bacterium]|nr:CoA transferase [Sphingomonadales bacterium]
MLNHPFAAAIAAALGPEPAPAVTLQAPARLPAQFDVTGLALTSMAAAAGEIGALSGAKAVTLNARRALLWFGMTLQPQGWAIPAPWDPIAGDYATADGWIRLHTNAPHHRAAALAVLDCDPTRAAVAEAVRSWPRDALETAVVAAGGAAAAMHDLAAWAAHPQGAAVAAEPLIHWAQVTEGPAQSLPLAGLRVLDLTRVLAGPVASRLLAGFGARVLRIDPPEWSEPGVEPEVTLGKRLARLDLRDPTGRATFAELIRGADVLVHGYRPGALEGLDLGAEMRRRMAPGLIEVTLDAYGWSGPWAGRRGFDSLVQMSCGIAAAGMQAAGADRPVPLPVQALDHATGYLMAAAVARALRLRAATGAVMSARLSLARTAALLTGAGMTEAGGDWAPMGAADLAPEIEETDWGPARRVGFPITLGGAGPVWRHRAGPLGRDAARW